jgi:MFS family permease
MLIGMSTAALASETKGFGQQPDDNDGDDNTHRDSSIEADTTKDRPMWARTWGLVKDHATTIRSNATKNIVCVSLAFLMSAIGAQALQLVTQYASKRFSWSFSRASLLITINGIVNIFVFLVIFPQISNVLVKRMSTVEKDLRISRGTAWALTVGAALMALAAHPSLFITGVCVFGLGFGFSSAFRSVATGLVAPSHVGVLNTTIAVSQGIGSMVAGPMMAAAFRRGMALGGFWLGLPYMVAAGLLFGTSCLTYGIRTSRRD